MIRPFHRIIRRIDHRIEQQAAAVQQCWERKGGPSRWQRWEMRNPVLAPLVGLILAIAAITGVHGAALLISGGIGALPPIGVTLAVLTPPLAFAPAHARLQRRLHERYLTGNEEDATAPTNPS
jgi:hypothetical protein